jgi:hypothetical protein
MLANVGFDSVIADHPANEATDEVAPIITPSAVSALELKS